MLQPCNLSLLLDARSRHMEWYDAIQSVFNLQWKKFARESLELTETEFQNCYEQIPNTNYERSYQALQKWHHSLDSTEDKEALLFDTLKAAYQRQLILETFQPHMNICKFCHNTVHTLLMLITVHCQIFEQHSYKK